MVYNWERRKSRECCGEEGPGGKPGKKPGAKGKTYVQGFLTEGELYTDGGLERNSKGGGGVLREKMKFLGTGGGGKNREGGKKTLKKKGG